MDSNYDIPDPDRDGSEPETSVKCAREGCSRFVDMPLSWVGTEREVDLVCDVCATGLLNEAFRSMSRTA